MPEEKKSLGEKAESAGESLVKGAKAGAHKVGDTAEAFAEGVKKEMNSNKTTEEKAEDTGESVIKGLKKEIKKIKKELKKGRGKKKNKKNKKDKKKK
jgi:hypothetical protein